MDTVVTLNPQLPSSQQRINHFTGRNGLAIGALEIHSHDHHTKGHLHASGGDGLRCGSSSTPEPCSTPRGHLQANSGQGITAGLPGIQSYDPHTKGRMPMVGKSSCRSSWDPSYDPHTKGHTPMVGRSSSRSSWNPKPQPIHHLTQWVTAGDGLSWCPEISK